MPPSLAEKPDVSPSGGRGGPSDRLILAALILLGICVRVPGLSASFYGDEGFSVLRDTNQLITPTEDRFRFVFFTLVYLWKQLGFSGEAGLRALPCLFGVLQIPVAFKLGKLLESPRAARVFALLVALSPVLIEFSQELRMYSLVPLIALVQALIFVSLLARRRAGRAAGGLWLAFVGVGALGLYTHFHYWFLIGGFGLAFLRRQRQVPLRSGVIALAAIALSYLPNVPNLLRFQKEAAGQAHLVATDVPSAVPKLVAAFGLGFNYFSLPHLGMERAIRGSVVVANLALTALLAVPALLIAWALVRMHRRRSLTEAIWLAHELFTGPVLFSFLASLALGRDFIHPKYMSFAAPFFLLFLAAGYLSLRGSLAQISTAVTGLAVMGVALVHFNQPQQYGRREDWRGAAVYLRSVLDEGSVLIGAGGPGSPARLPTGGPPRSLLEYYAPDIISRLQIVAVPRHDVTTGELETVLRPIIRGKRHVYYLWSEIGANFNDPGDVLIRTARQEMSNEQKVQFNPRLVVYRWDRAGD